MLFDIVFTVFSRILIGSLRLFKKKNLNIKSFPDIGLLSFKTLGWMKLDEISDREQYASNVGEGC